MNVVKIEEIESRVLTLRDESVLLDSEVAGVYGIATEEVNQAVSSNPETFQSEYIIKLAEAGKQEVVKKSLTTLPS